MTGYDTGSTADVMNYNYYRGMLFVGLERFDEALHCFELVLDTPHPILHILQAQAFKKIILLKWLTSIHNPNDIENKGVRVSIRAVLSSKGMSGKHLEALCHNYSKAQNINNFFILCNSEEIIKDGNLGLIKQVVRKLRNDITHLPKIYNMLDIQEVQKRLEGHRGMLDLAEEEEKRDIVNAKGVSGKALEEIIMKIQQSSMEDINSPVSLYGGPDEDVMTVLTKMIKNGKIKAKIDLVKGIVAFDDEESDMVGLVKTIESQAVEMTGILSKLDEAHQNLILKKKAGEVEDKEQFLGDFEEDWMDDMA